MPSKCGTHARAGFTLIELLVVISVITLLIAILLPALGRARESGNRAVCLSNLRQLGIGIRGYAMEQGDRVPLGAAYGYKQLDYCIWLNGHAAALGTLFHDGFVTDPRAYFCPSETDPELQFQQGTLWTDPINPFPLDWNVLMQPGNNFSIRCTYGNRVLNGTEFWDAGTPAALPLLANLQGKALMADMIGLNIYPADQHTDGINVAYDDGSAHWVRIDRIATPIPTVFTPVNNPIVLDDSVSPNTGVWADLDHL